MRRPIDAKLLSFIALSAPNPVVDFKTQVQKVNAQGQPVVSVSVAASADDGSEIWEIRVPGQPKGIVPGAVLEVRQLTLSRWEIGDRHGETFVAGALEIAAPATPKA
jgi:hypothetical protein